MPTEYANPVLFRDDVLDPDLGSGTALREIHESLVGRDSEMIERALSDLVQYDLPLFPRLSSDAYVNMERLGGGAFGNVDAYMTRDGFSVALKDVGWTGSTEHAMAKREVRMLSRCSHPNIIQIADIQRVGKRYILLQPWVPNTTPFREGLIPDKDKLLKFLKPGANKNLLLTQALNFPDPDLGSDHPLRDLITGLIFLQLAGALVHMQSRGVVHSDIKPDNIVIWGVMPMVLDLGGAVDPEVISTGGAYTVGYASPELMAKRSQHRDLVNKDSRLQKLYDTPVDSRHDVFSLGCTFFEYYSGNSPFIERYSKSGFAEAAENVLFNRRRFPLDGAPPEMTRLIRKMMHSDPDKRPTPAKVYTTVRKFVLPLYRKAALPWRKDPFTLANEYFDRDAYDSGGRVTNPAEGKEAPLTMAFRVDNPDSFRVGENEYYFKVVPRGGKDFPVVAKKDDTGEIFGPFYGNDADEARGKLLETAEWQLRLSTEDLDRIYRTTRREASRMVNDLLINMVRRAQGDAVRVTLVELFRDAYFGELVEFAHGLLYPKMVDRYRQRQLRRQARATGRMRDVLRERRIAGRPDTERGLQIVREDMAVRKQKMEEDLQKIEQIRARLSAKGSQ
jgi:serine/threonine protein kinase